MGDIDRICNVSLLCESLAAQGDVLRTVNEKRAARGAQRPALARARVAHPVHHWAERPLPRSIQNNSGPAQGPAGTFRGNLGVR
jgi:hypothetical protein